MSTPAPHPASAQAALLQAGQLGRRHGKAAAHWQIGDSSSADAQPSCRDLLRGICEADQQTTGMHEVPGLTARWDYDRDSLAAGLGLAHDDPGMAQAADTYLAAAREEFWLEAARLARRRLPRVPGHRAGDSDQAGRTHPEPRSRAARTRAEDQDGAELPAPILAGITGLNINTATSWTRSTGRDWTEYLAARTPHQDEMAGCHPPR